MFCPNSIDSLPEFMSTNSPNWGAAAPLPPVPYAYVAVVQQCAGHAGIVDYHIFFISRQLGVCSHYRARVEAAFPILLPISVSNVRLVLMAEPRYVNWQTNSSSYLTMVMTGGASVSFPTTFVFSRLIVSPKPLLARDKQSVGDWSSCRVAGVGRNCCVISVSVCP